MEWKLEEDGDRARVFIRHLTAPRFRAELVEHDNTNAEIPFSSWEALGSVEWIDPRPDPEELLALLFELEAFLAARSG